MWRGNLCKFKFMPHFSGLAKTRYNLIKIMDKQLEQLQNEIALIKKRNQRVETDKAWETSWVRKIIILFLTYIVIVIFFFFAHLPKPFINAIVPALAFVLSTLTVPLFKNLWLKKFYKCRE